MDNVIAFHPPKSDLILFYEVVDGDGNASYGSADPYEVMHWYKTAPTGSRILVSGWESDDEDAHLVGQPLDITAIVREASR
jgi:hypothetical protein